MESPLWHLFLANSNRNDAVEFLSKGLSLLRQDSSDNEQILRELQVNRWVPEIQDKIRHAMDRENCGCTG